MKKTYKTKSIFAFIIIMYVFTGSTNQAYSITPDEIREFEDRYAAWEKDIKNVALNSTWDKHFSTNYWAIVDMGIKVIPHVIDKGTNDANSVFIWRAWDDILRFCNMPDVNPWTDDDVFVWWNGGQKLGKERSELVVEKAKEARKTGDKKAEERQWYTLAHLGLFACETLFKELKAGDEAAVGAIKIIFQEEIKSGKLKENATAAELLAWWEKHKDEYKLPPGKDAPNQKPEDLAPIPKPTE